MEILKKLFLKMAAKGFFNWLPDEQYLKMIYKCRIGRKLNLKNPKTFNEKMQWLKLYNRKTLYTQLVDKYEVRKYIAEKIGKDYLIPQIALYGSVKEINFEELPEEFVLKCTHDSGGIVICKNKNSLDIKKVKKKLNKLMKRNYFYWGREWPYKNIKPRIICEQFIEDKKNKELIDYKFMCFGGEVKCTFVCCGRNSQEGIKISIYDRNWNKMSVGRHNKMSNVVVTKPDKYEQMMQLAEKLSKDFPFLRVDFYEVNEKIYFGELTFFPSSGLEKFEPEEFDTIFGEWIKI